MKKIMMLLCMLGLAAAPFAQSTAMSQDEANRQLRLAFEYEDWNGAVDLISLHGADITRVETISPLTPEEATYHMLASASFENWGSVISLIEQTSPQVEAADDDGNTVLMFAAQKGSLAIVRYLISYKKVSPQYINAVNKSGETALSLAEDDWIMELLMDHGATMECED